MPEGESGHTTDRHRRDAPLGTLVYRAGLLTASEVEEALGDAVARGKRLGQVLVEKGLVDEADIARLLAEQRNLSFVTIKRPVDREAIGLLRADVAWLNHAVPVWFDGDELVVAIHDPSDELLRGKLSEALGRRHRLVVATRSEILRLLAEHYPTAASALDRVAPVQPVPPAGNGVVAGVPAVPAPPAAGAAPPAAERMREGDVAPPDAAPASPALRPPVPAEAPRPAVGFDAQPLSEPAARPAPDLFAVPEPAIRVAEPTPVAEATRAAEATPVPEPTPVPQPTPVAEPMPVAEPTPVAEPVPAAPDVPEAAPPPTPPAVEPAAGLAEPAAPAAPPTPGIVRPRYRLVFRLVDGERLDVGAFASDQEAKDHARALIQRMSVNPDEWPFVRGRFVRPHSIVSLDVVAGD